MRILFISQTFPPEMGAGAARCYELSRKWVQMGHSVTVVTGFPNHPTGIIYEGYKNKPFQREVIDGIHLVRVWLYPAPNKGLYKRAANWTSFMFSAMTLGALLSGQQDVVIATAPQLLVGVAGLFLSKLKNIPFVFDVRDLWPETVAPHTNVINSSLVINVIDRLVTRLYQSAKLIVTVTHSMPQYIIKRGVPANKVKVVTNGVDCTLFRPMDRNNSIAKEYHLQDKFVVSYIGTHGAGQGLQSILHTAHQLREYDDILFLFVGEGAEKDNLIDISKKLNLKNTRFLDKQSRELMPLFLATSDVSLAHIRGFDVYSYIIPSKIFEVMAMARPLILCAKSEANQIIESANAGICVEPENPQQLADAIIKLYNSPELRERLGQNGRQYVVQHYSRDNLAIQYAGMLEELIHG